MRIPFTKMVIFPVVLPKFRAFQLLIYHSRNFLANLSIHLIETHYIPIIISLKLNLNEIAIGLYLWYWKAVFIILVIKQFH